MERMACGCPGSQVRNIQPRREATGPAGSVPSELRQWPTQLRLVPPTAPWLEGADLLVAADCTPFAYGDFHRDFIKGRVLVNACPKLDDTSSYVAKLAEIFAGNDLKSITPPERVDVLDLQLDLLTTGTEASLADDRDVALALHEDREGIGAAAGSDDPDA